MSSLSGMKIFCTVLFESIVNNNGVVYLLSGIFSFFNEVVICFPKKFFLNLFSISFEKNIIYLFLYSWETLI